MEREEANVSESAAELEGSQKERQVQDIGPEHDPYASHLSDQQHFNQSPDPKERERGLGVYGRQPNAFDGLKGYYERARKNPAFLDDGN